MVSGRDLALVEPDGTTTTLFRPPGVTGINDLTSDGAGGVLAGALRYRPMAGEDPVAMMKRRALIRVSPASTLSRLMN